MAVPIHRNTPSEGMLTSQTQTAWKKNKRKSSYHQRPVETRYGTKSEEFKAEKTQRKLEEYYNQ